MTESMIESTDHDGCTILECTGSTENAGLTLEGENALHYVGGYMTRELRLDKAYVQIFPLLEQLTYSEKSPFDNDSMQQSINQVNRGGLTRIDQFHASKSIYGTLMRSIKQRLHNIRLPFGGPKMYRNLWDLKL